MFTLVSATSLAYSPIGGSVAGQSECIIFIVIRILAFGGLNFFQNFREAVTKVAGVIYFFRPIAEVGEALNREENVVFIKMIEEVNKVILIPQSVGVLHFPKGDTAAGGELRIFLYRGGGRVPRKEVLGKAIIVGRTAFGTVNWPARRREGPRTGLRPRGGNAAGTLRCRRSRFLRLENSTKPIVGRVQTHEIAEGGKYRFTHPSSSISPAIAFSPGGDHRLQNQPLFHRIPSGLPATRHSWWT